MKQLYEDLWQLEATFPFGGSAFAYVLACDAGRLMIYSTEKEAELDAIDEAGGIECQILCHQDEAGEPLVNIKERFGSALCCHELEVAQIAKYAPVDHAFQGEKNELGGLQIYHTPGHTVGSISLLYESPFGKTYLFSGDTVFGKNDGGFGTLVRQERIEVAKDSLRFLKTLSPDLIFWAASPGTLSHYEMSAQQWRDSLDSAIENMQPYSPSSFR